MLIESRSATWLYGTAAEHSVFYQYNFNKAKNIFTTMIQTESPYYQPMPKLPAPFKAAVGKWDRDPDYSCNGGDFSGCDESWAILLRDSTNIHVGSAGTYSWFSSYSQDFIDKHACQNVLWHVDNNYDNVRLNHIVAIGAKYVMVANGKGVTSAENLAINEHPAWARISLFDVDSKGADNSDDNSNTNANTGICNPKDTMWTRVSMPEGQLMPFSYLDPTEVPASAVYYVTIGLSLEFLLPARSFDANLLLCSQPGAVQVCPRIQPQLQVQDLGVSRCPFRLCPAEHN